MPKVDNESERNGVRQKDLAPTSLRGRRLDNTNYRRIILDAQALNDGVVASTRQRKFLLRTVHQVHHPSLLGRIPGSVKSLRASAISFGLVW